MSLYSVKTAGAGLALSTALAIFFFSFSFAQAATINVPADHATIGAAISAASAGDTVNIAAGTYEESLTINKANLRLVGAGVGLTIIAPGSGNGIRLNGAGNGATISNLSLDGPGTGCNCRGILVFPNRTVSISDVESYDFTSGIYLENGVTATISNLYTHDNVAGIGSSGVESLTITNSRFINNGPEGGFGTSDSGSASESGPVSISGTTFGGNSPAILVEDSGSFGWGGGIITLENNYWGSGNPDFTALMVLKREDVVSALINSGVVSVDATPWCANNTCSASNSGTEVTNTLSSPVASSTVTAAGTIEIQIPPTVITSTDTSWDGTIALPQVISDTSAVAVTADSGTIAEIVSAIEVGAGDIPLSLNAAARLFFAGQTGKLVGWTRAGFPFTPITDPCSADTQPVGDALPADGNCVLDNGTDLIVWTKHFTTYVVYTQTPIPPPPAPSSSVGGGGGIVGPNFGLVAQAAITPPVRQVLGTSTAAVATAHLAAPDTALPSPSFKFSKPLYYGMRGAEVGELQQRLMVAGVYNANVTGFFGPITLQAVKTFQAKNKLMPVGSIGPLTRTLLNKILMQ